MADWQYTSALVRPDLKIYRDRGYVLTSYPPLLADARLIQAHNGRKAHMANMLTCTALQAVSVVVAWDERHMLAPWLFGYQALPLTIETTDRQAGYGLFMRTFQVGEPVIFGPPACPAWQCSHYLPFLVAVNGS